MNVLFIISRINMFRPCICGSNQRSRKNRKPTIDTLIIGAGYFVICLNCGLESEPAHYKEEAINNWNEMIKTKKQ